MRHNLSNVTPEEFSLHVVRLQKYHKDATIGEDRLAEPKRGKSLIAAKHLGLTLDDIKGYYQQLVAWMAAGYPELTPEEAAARNICCVHCDKKRPLGFAMEKTDTCNSKGTGCGSGRNRPPLWVLRKLPNCHCPDNKWPGDVHPTAQPSDS
jgi:hypothetical protein